ncbi:DUF2125 domain-containing protein [Hyphococcus flavus]|uniref:DUF2125 domain-containing protein n=1 Tax=Hyphococcus flavus TaxID=1866326 RepID=A0AAF0CCB2_9PROT|nr:DUF2125 domain-containing protein [Hyphococcus flavus]WDI33055.1 DUF2125 domain-containing protein [Hyphococcus flavus]
MAEHHHRLSRRWLYIPFIIAGVILIGYYMLWRTGAAEMKKGVEAWVADQRSAGLEITHGPITSDGFPFFLRVHVDNPDISQPDLWRWRTSRLTMDALPYDLRKLIFSTRTEQYLWTEDHGEWRVIAKDFRTSISADDTRGWVFATTIGEGSATRMHTDETIQIENLKLDLAPDSAENTTLTLNLAATGLSAINGAKAVELDTFRTMLALTHTDAFAFADPVSVWRQAGGRLIIRGLSAEIDDAHVMIAGEINLDSENYPAGQLNTEIVNPAVFTEVLHTGGAISRNEAQSVAAALSLAAIAGGGKINAPIHLKDKTAQIAGVTLAGLPKVD